MSKPRSPFWNNTKAQLIEMLDKNFQDRYRVQAAKHVTQGLLEDFSEVHGQGVDLIPWLTSQPCHDNQEALSRWVHGFICDPYFMSPDADILPSDYLMVKIRLRELLAKIEASRPC